MWGVTYRNSQVKGQWFLYISTGLTFKNYLFCPQSAFVRVLFGCHTKQPLFPHTTLTDGCFNQYGACLVRGTIFRSVRAYGFVMSNHPSVRPYARNSAAPTGRISGKFDTKDLYDNTFSENPNLVKVRQIFRMMIYACLILLSAPFVANNKRQALL
jgi:hypothetical protein